MTAVRQAVTRQDSESGVIYACLRFPTKANNLLCLRIVVVVQKLREHGQALLKRQRAWSREEEEIFKRAPLVDRGPENLRGAKIGNS